MKLTINPIHMFDERNLQLHLHSRHYPIEASKRRRGDTICVHVELNICSVNEKFYFIIVDSSIQYNSNSNRGERSGGGYSWAALPVLQSLSVGVRSC